MDSEERNAEFEAVRAESLEILERTADVKVVYRVHRDDGLLTEHSVNMPKKPPPPTMAEVEQKIADAKTEITTMIADVKAALPRAPTADEVRQIARDEIASMLRGPDGLIEGIAETFASRKQIKELRSKIAGLTLRLDGLMHATAKRQTIAAHVEAREAEVINLMRRSQRRA